MTDTIYRFTKEQLDRLLNAHGDMLVEYRDIHGYEESLANCAATGEILEGLDGEREMVEDRPHRYAASLQTMPEPDGFIAPDTPAVHEGSTDEF